MLYVTYLLDLGGEGSRIDRASLKFAPDPKTTPKTAFVWKIVRDSNGLVVVRGLEGRKLAVLGTAQWAGGLRDKKQRRTATTPTDYQWDLVESTLSEAAAAHPDAPVEGTFVDGLDETEVDLVEISVAEAAASQANKSAKDARRNSDREWRGWERKDPKRQDKRALIALLVVTSGIAAVYLGVRWSAQRSLERTTAKVASEPVPAARAAPEPVVVKPPPPPRVETFATAVTNAKAEINAVSPAGDYPEGAQKLASFRLAWSDVDAADATTVARVEKDPTSEQGKALCASGELERITRRDIDGRTYFVGALKTLDGDRVTFLVAGSTGELVKRDKARVCGVVTGTVGGDAAVFGMLDLPENRNPIVEAP